MNLYNVLKSMPFELTTHNVGSVDSIGNVVFLAGEKRYAVSSATFMFHGVGFDINQPTRLDQQTLEERLDSLLSDQKRIGAVIQQHTKISESEIADLFRQQETKDADFAADSEIIDEIREVKLTGGTPVISLIFGS